MANLSERLEMPLADHIILFGRVLRRAGLKVGTDQIMEALRAVALVGVRRRDDVYSALFSVLVMRREDVEVFDRAFEVFWRAPARLPELMEGVLPRRTGVPPRKPRKGMQRILQALQEHEARRQSAGTGEGTRREQVVTYSADEVLRKKDFADFTAEELAAARAMMREMRWPVAPRRTRRRTPREKGARLDLRRTMRGALRHDAEIVALRYQGRKRKARPVVVLCDISGSMERYARMLLHFVHTVTEGMQRVESFVFGTRLTRITRYLRRRDIDAAVAAVAGEVSDWSGGTRIGEALHAFNYRWLRRVLPSDGVVLLISDGWDRGDPELLGREMARLHGSCHRLFWLTPLMGYAGYEPLTQGLQAALPHVDAFLPVHNLASLEELGRVLSSVEFNVSF